MGKFLLYPGYRNVFACMKCELSRNGARDYQCEECGSHACEHLVERGPDGYICFCCLDPEREGDWPDWCFTMVPTKSNQGKNGR